MVTAARQAPGDLSERQKQEYWVTTSGSPPSCWSSGSWSLYMISGSWRAGSTITRSSGSRSATTWRLQGSLAIFVIEIAAYAYLMNKKDEEYGNLRRPSRHEPGQDLRLYTLRLPRRHRPDRFGEALGLFSNKMIGWIFMALSLLIYVFIGIVTRTSNPDQYYVAGRGVPPFYNGMATGSDWMSAASFISMGGALSAQGFAGLAYVMGWTGVSAPRGLPRPVSPAVRRLHDPRLPGRPLRRQRGAYRRRGRRGACSFTYLIAQVTGVGLIVAASSASTSTSALRRPPGRVVLLRPRRHDARSPGPRSRSTSS